MAASHTPEPCAACGAEGASSMCSSCRAACYCGQACQRLAWPAHKAECAALRAAREQREVDVATAAGFILLAKCARCGRGPSAAPGGPCRCFVLWYCDECGPPRRHSPAVCEGAARARFEHLRAGAEAGDPVAMHNLAGCYAEGSGVPASAAENLAWLRRAGELGWAESLNNLGASTPSRPRPG